MLTCLETVPDAAAADIPPLYNQAPLQAAIRAGHGKYGFTSDNKVLFFGDKGTDNEYIINHNMPAFALNLL